MSEIQDQAYSEAMDEIERLTRLNFEATRLASELAQENKRLKVLLAAAAEALEKWNIRDRFSELIRQLRRELAK